MARTARRGLRRAAPERQTAHARATSASAIPPLRPTPLLLLLLLGGAGRVCAGCSASRQLRGGCRCLCRRAHLVQVGG